MTEQKLVLKFKRMEKILILALSLLTAYTSIGQPEDLEKVNLEMLTANQSTINPNASAEILYEKGEISFVSIKNELKYLYEVTVRIKIYDEDGYNQSNIQIPYYLGKGNVKEAVKKIKAKTYYEEDGKVKSEKVRNKDIYEVELNEFYKAKKFTFPKIQNGVIIEYSYIEESPYIQKLPSWSFQSNIPTKYSEFQTFIPTKYITYRKHVTGFYPIKTEEDFSENLLGGSQVKTTIAKTTHYAKSLSAIDPENYVNNKSNYATAISYEASTLNAAGLSKHFSSDWESVVENMKKNINYEKEIDNSRYFADDLDEVLKNTATDQEKMEAIFEFVKQKVKWNDRNSAYVSDRLKKVYDEGIGNAADINMILVAMLNYADFEANPVVLSTISSGLALFPSITKFNYVIARVKVDGEFILLDASSKHSSPNILPTKALNGQGFELTSYGFKNVELVPEEASNINYNLLAQINEAGNISGQCRVFYFNQFGLNARSAFSNQSQESITKLLNKHYKLDHISNFSQLNLENLQKPLVQSFKFEEASGFVEKIGDKLYLSPLIFLSMENNPFKEQERKHPVDFTFPKSYTYRLQIDLPQDYVVDYIPEKAVYKMEDDVLSFSYIIQEYNGKLVIDVSKNISTAYVLPNNYHHLVKYYNSMFEKENEKVVLVKQ